MAHSGVGDAGHLQVEAFEFGQPGKVLQVIVRHVRVSKVKAIDAAQLRQVTQSTCGKAMLFACAAQVEAFESTQTGKVLKPGSANRRIAEAQTHELRESGNVFQGGVGKPTRTI